LQVNKFGQVIISDSEFFTSLYQGDQIGDISKIQLNDPQSIKQFNQSRLSNGDRFGDLSNMLDISGMTVEQFDKMNQSHWMMPDSYKNMDISMWLIDQCSNQEKLNRAVMELEYFLKYNMLDLLRYLKYLVDTMRDHNIVWGVGRGSSTASYCLYLIGIHKIDCLRYQIPIEEFFKNQGEKNDL
jgi:DNA polymerase III alpha subunit